MGRAGIVTKMAIMHETAPKGFLPFQAHWLSRRPQAMARLLLSGGVNQVVRWAIRQGVALLLEAWMLPGRVVQPAMCGALHAKVLDMWPRSVLWPQPARPLLASERRVLQACPRLDSPQAKMCMGIRWWTRFCPRWQPFELILLISWGLCRVSFQPSDKRTSAYANNCMWHMGLSLSPACQATLLWAAWWSNPRHWGLGLALIVPWMRIARSLGGCGRLLE